MLVGLLSCDVLWAICRSRQGSLTVDAVAQQVQRRTNDQEVAGSTTTRTLLAHTQQP